MFEKRGEYRHERIRGHGTFSGQTSRHSKDCKADRDTGIVSNNTRKLLELIDLAEHLTDRGQLGAATERYHSFTADLYVDSGSGSIREIDYYETVDQEQAEASGVSKLRVEVLAASVDFLSRPGLCPHTLNIIAPEDNPVTDLEAYISRRALTNLAQSLAQYNEQ